MDTASEKPVGNSYKYLITSDSSDDKKHFLLKKNSYKFYMHL